MASKGQDLVIYGLRDPRTREIRYVGQTRNLAQRVRAHEVDASHTYKACWLRKLAAAGLSVEVVVLERVAALRDLDTAEQKWIAVGRAALGSRFTNATAGGGGVLNLALTARAKISVALRRHYESEEARAKTGAAVSVALRRHYESEEARAKTGAASRRTNARPEVKEKLRVAGRKNALRLAVVGRVAMQDTETRERHRAAMRAVWADPERRRKQSERLKARAAAEQKCRSRTSTPS